VRKGEGLGLPRRSEPMNMGMWDIKSGRGHYASFYLNSSRSAVGQLERTCVVDITVNSTLQLPSPVFFWLLSLYPMIENPIQSSILLVRQ